jgi:predicted dehydrogenase
MKPIRLGLIGCGGMGRGHGRAFTQQVRGAKIAAFCDPNTDNLARFQREILDPLNQRPLTFPDHRALLRAVELDAVVIVTPHTQHFAQTMDALAAGRHVLLEKPMVTRVDHAR